MSIHIPPTSGIIYSPATTSGQPRISPIAHFVSSANDGLGKETFDDKEAVPTAGRLLAVNSSYIAYAVKKGLVRVIDRRSSSKALLRGHGSRIVDAAFFGESQKEGIGGLWKELAAARTGEFSTTGAASNTGAVSAASDILATIGGLNDSLFIWRVYNDGELKADKLIELKFGFTSTVGCPSRILWHPFDPNRFLLLHRKSNKSVASLVETKRLVTQRAVEGHMVCECERDVPGATQFIVSDNDAAAARVNDASWSGKDARHVLTAHDDGIRLWDIIAPVVETEDDKKSFQCIAKLAMEEVTRVIFLSQYENQVDSITPPFITGTDMNHTLTLWAGFNASGTAKKVSSFSLKSSTSSISTLMSVELIPAPYRPTDTVPSSFLLVSERENARMHALHLASEWKSSGGVSINGFDYVSSLDVVHPILSQCIAASNTNANLDEERDVELCCVQTKAVQLLSLSGEMVTPPKSMEVPSSIILVDEDDNEAEEFEEDYDMEEDPTTEFSTEHETDNNVTKNEPDTANPFSNWLGALATGNSAAAPPVPPAAKTAPPPPPGLDFMFPPPPPPGMAPTDGPPMQDEMSFLSPAELMNKSEPTPEPVLSNTDADTKKSSGKKKKDGKKSPSVAIPDRQEDEARPASHPSGSNADIRSMENSIERIIASQMKSFECKVLDVVKKTVASEVEKSMGSSKVKNIIEKAAKENASATAREAVRSIQAPLVASFHQTMKEILIPSYEAATTQMFHQISKSVDQGVAQIANSQSRVSQPSIEAMSMQMTKMAEAIKTLSSEIAQLKAGGAAIAKNGSQPASKPQPKQTDVRQEILALCRARQYEEAFTKAVSAANGDIVVFTCKSSDITAAFNGEVTLSQTILICLMQQLGAVLVSVTDPTDFKTIVMWLQEIAVTIDPTNENIQRHVGSVVQQLLANINSKMSNCDPAFRRPLLTLMQVIRGGLL